jgi:hypothetical protein
MSGSCSPLAQLPKYPAAHADNPPCLPPSLPPPPRCAATVLGLFAGGAAYWSTRTAVRDRSDATAGALAATRRMFAGAPPQVGTVRNPQPLAEHEKYAVVRTGWNGAVQNARTFVADVFFSKDDTA